MNLHKLGLFAILALGLVSEGKATNLIEYHMHLPPSESGKRVALTLDACTGKVDKRILNALIENKIKATIFVTARWLKRNPKTIATLKANNDLFEIENHGGQHVPAIDEPKLVFGLKAAGSPQALTREIETGTKEIEATFGHKSQWYRGAAALYTGSSLKLISDLDLKTAGFSLSGDGGASWTSPYAAKTIAAAKDGDVIIAHINQPTKPAGTGVVLGVLKLKAKGFIFVTLAEGFALAPKEKAPDRGR